jgi:competence ComEA-like helix-hairpin-helix protein
VRVATNICGLISLACVGFALGDWAAHPNALGMLGILALIAAFGFLLSFLYRPGSARAPRAPAPARSGSAALSGPPEGYAPPPPPPAPPARVNLNRARVSELATLPGVGPSAAQRIVDERDASGPYATVADLARVPGFNPEKVRALGDRARV